MSKEKLIIQTPTTFSEIPDFEPSRLPSLERPESGDGGWGEGRGGELEFCVEYNIWYYF